ncbi:S8 family serine peptidase [Maribius pontilimi]|uniref:S8 family serine peptidase n=1 Tax=Palleronia pontilimi TaxID=1964209 RepID=A0A934IJF6_9RHOB|nr:phage tail tip lysozyme [Palleronia pontilimi]MBJ3763670.1 S8 family serine peptidase [Palleronia pontilimi]
MDPQLWEEIERGAADEDIRALVRLYPGMSPPATLRPVSRFGDILTCRLRRSDILAARSHASVRSLKAARGLEPASRPGTTPPTRSGQVRRPQVRETGAGVVLGVIDYGCDFAHRAFRKPDGASRIEALWHQGARARTGLSPDPFDQGRVWKTRHLDRALRQANPYRALGYMPSSRGADGRRHPSHGTHVLGIAAGGLDSDGPVGMAPDADIVFVHVDSGDTSGLLNFGDSVGVLEALDFILQSAGDRPAAVNISMGRHGGPHDGSTLIEQAMDHVLDTRRGVSIVQSAGNYYGGNIHCTGTLRPGQTTRFAWRVQPAATGTKELEVWLNGEDTTDFEITAPDGTRWDVPPGARVVLEKDGVVLGRAYHRLDDPGNGDTHIDVFLYEGSGSDGVWQAGLAPRRIVTGTWHAWLERHGRSRNQTRFTRGPRSDSTTGGTIAHGRRPIQVAAHRADPPYAFTRFSSAGPARDGRSVPLIAAPGEAIVSARSATSARATGREVTRMNGTSMAAPHVTGTVALMLQAAPTLSQAQIRHILRRTARPMAANIDEVGLRSAWGRLDAAAAVRAARRGAARPAREAGGPAEQLASRISASEWRVVESWVSVGQVPVDGGGALAPNQSALNAVALPDQPVAAARACAQALLNRRNRIQGTPTITHPIPRQTRVSDSVLDPLARQLVAAMPLGDGDWQTVGRFVEAQLTANRSTPAPTSPMIGPDDARNRLNIAHLIACERETAFSGGVAGPSAACGFPQSAPASAAAAITRRQLRRLGPIVDWVQVPLDQRRVHVMERLIDHYRFPVNAAAGIVGNLESESGILPERLESAARATPRLALALRGPRRRFSAQEVRDRSRRLGRGPRLPGVGLAQWTTARRRRLPFAHRYRGVTLGAYVLYFMDVQIDVLVSELGNTAGFRTLLRNLRDASRTVNQAADDFVYIYEIPGRLLEPDPARPGRRRRRARTDPQAQAVFAERRARAQRALAAYRAAHPAQGPDRIETPEPIA